MTLLAARAVLALLAVYHLVTGALALAAPSAARRLAHALYRATLTDAASMNYAVSMIGAQAIAIGILAAVAATDPTRHRSIVASLALLQLLRAVVRVGRARLLRDSLGVPSQRNAGMIAILVAESAILAAFLA